MCHDLVSFACGCVETLYRRCESDGRIAHQERTACARHRYLNVEGQIVARGRPLHTHTACERLFGRPPVACACSHTAPVNEVHNVHKYDSHCDEHVCRRCIDAWPSVAAARERASI